jgi:LysR family transcriptional regulator, nitrogen assimilation regulatory protein
MDLRQLRYFVGIVQAGSLSRAADRLHVAQSAISHHLASLEAELGRELVTRPRGILLTQAGTILCRHAEAILRHVESAKQDAKRALDVPSGRVSIGFPVALAAVLGYQLFMRLRTTSPHILPHIIDGKSSLLREQLVNGRLDMAVLFADRSERGLAVEPVLLEELFYVTADPDTSPVRISDIARRPLLLPGPWSSNRQIVQEAFEQRGLTVAPIGELEALSAFRRAVASGVGNAILPWSALYEDDRKITLNYRPIIDAKLVRPVALCFSEVAQRSPAVDLVAKTLKSLVRELVESGSWRGVSLIESSRELAHALILQKVGRTPIPRSPRRALRRLETHVRQAGSRP